MVAQSDASRRRSNSVASLIDRSGSSAFRLSATAVSMSLTGSCFSSESAPRPFHHGSRERGGTIFWAALPLDERRVQATERTHLSLPKIRSGPDSHRKLESSHHPV